MVLKRLFISDAGERSAVHLNCSGLPGDRAFEQIIFSWKMVLKRQFIGETVEDSTLYIESPCLLGDNTHLIDTIFLLERWS